MSRKRTGKRLPGLMPTENPKEIPVIRQERIEEIRRYFEQKKRRDLYAGIKDPPCPACEVGILRPASNLELEWAGDGPRTVLKGLTGYRCDKCGKAIFDGESSRTISRFLERSRAPTGYSATVSALGGGKVGIYLPKDVLKAVDFEPRDELRITPVGRRKVVIEKV